MEEEIALNQYLKPRPNATFVTRVKGDSMENAHIPNDALLIVDRSLKPSKIGQDEAPEMQKSLF